MDKYIENFKERQSEHKYKHIVKINVAVSSEWIDSHINLLPDMISGFNGKKHPLFINAKVVLLANHQIILLPHVVSDEQMYAEFLSLLFVIANEQYSVDIIIHIQSWRFFMTVAVGCEFFQMLKHQTEFEEYAKGVTKENINIVSSEFGCISYPPKDQINKAGRHMKLYLYMTSYICEDQYKLQCQKELNELSKTYEEESFEKTLQDLCDENENDFTNYNKTTNKNSNRKNKKKHKNFA